MSTIIRLGPGSGIPNFDNLCIPSLGGFIKKPSLSRGISLTAMSSGGSDMISRCPPIAFPRGTGGFTPPSCKPKPTNRSIIITVHATVPFPIVTFMLFTYILLLVVHTR
eukprot:m.248877 g.248877  ORF g.248877 m.248877 type:complete len:109 (-) comp16138_c0_seq1:33-359(-)